MNSEEIVYLDHWWKQQMQKFPPLSTGDSYLPSPPFSRLIPLKPISYEF